jgi:acetoacetate decarboxylase
VGHYPVILDKPDLLYLRWFPPGGPGKAKPAVCELVRLNLSAVHTKDAWEGEATLRLLPAPDSDVGRLKPQRVHGGYRYSISMSIGGLEILEVVDATP